MKKTNLMYEKYVKEFKYKYYMVKSTKTFKDYNDQIEIFGIRIDKLLKGNILETKEISSVGINKNDVEGFLKRVSDNVYEPSDLKEIEEEYIKSVS